MVKKLIKRSFKKTTKSKTEEGQKESELYVKPTDRTRYLHKDSDHPKHVKEGIAKGQFRRLRRICSKDEDYWRYGRQIEEKLTSRGYGKNQVKQQMKEAFKMERSEALTSHPRIAHGQRYPMPCLE